MSSVVISGDTSGTVSVTVPAVAGTNTVTIPAATGTVMVSGNMPAFSAYQSSAQTLSSNTWTKIQLQSEEFDTNNCFDSTTNYRFTPNVAGYYQITGSCQVNNQVSTMSIDIYKNGAEFKKGNNTGNTTFVGVQINSLIYMNGSTDYVELYFNIGTGQPLVAGAIYTYFQGFLARAA